MKQYIKAFFITIVFVCGFALLIPSTGVLAAPAANYSCGSYGGGNYSTGDGCSSTDNVTPPNTGFAALLRPNYAIPITLSVIAIAVGVGLIIRKRRQA